jgi:signal transduction histidine kinase
MSDRRQISNYSPSELELFIHDIASPLTNIGISLENMKTEIYSNPHKLEKTIVATIDSLEYLFSITKQNITRNTQQTSTAYLLDDLIHEILTNKFGFMIEKNNIGLIDVIHDEIPISYDRMLLNRVLTNIISNSIDALIEKSSEKHRKLKISTKRLHNHVLISFLDNGIGISSESLRNIFDIGYSGKVFHQGIGLPTSKDIIENRFGGKFEIHSLLGIGTIVKIYLPI